MARSARTQVLPRGEIDAQQVAVAAEVLAAAFRDDPIFTGTLRDPVRRVAALPLLWRALAQHCAGEGWIDLAERDGQPAGAALWVDGLRADIGWTQVARLGLVRMGLAAGLRDALRLMSVQERIGQVHHQLMSAPHLYLLGLGVLPGRQGEGVGSELLDRGLATADRLQLPAYLETNLEQNARLYRRKGFQVVQQDTMHGFHTWFMVRPTS
ncbi:GNAT family N-acetyltransferase [Luteococcus peritonei]|uniref:GNAT family N-acetyltransferase n=1 Tax=Luteococcus peritonei TaxID=88874 RepID=A0ABW4RWC0_9ACTN